MKKIERFNALRMPSTCDPILQRAENSSGILVPRHWLLALAVLLLAAAGLWCANRGLPDMAWWQTQRGQMQALYDGHPYTFAACLFGCFTLLSALALPGCGVLALAAGAYLGLVAGTALVLLASTLGASASFLAARHLFRNSVQRRWGHRLRGIEAGLARDGSFYLFSLRVAPLIPYGLVNPLMGLSQMPLARFFWVSLIGMLAGSAAYVYAGTQLVTAPGQALDWHELSSPGFVTALLLLALLPWCARALWRKARPAQP